MAQRVRERGTTPVPRPAHAPPRPRRTLLGRLLPRAVRTRINRFDDAAESVIDRVRGHERADQLFYALSELGDFSLLWLVLGSAQGLRGDHVSMRRGLRLAGALALEQALVNGIIKLVIRRTRPVPDFVRPLPLRIPRTTSFPSGHASAAFSSAALLSEGEPRAMRRFYYGLAAAVSTSRVYVKIHHASDVLGGVAVGVIFGALVRRLFPLPRRGES